MVVVGVCMGLVSWGDTGEREERNVLRDGQWRLEEREEGEEK